MLDSLLVEWGYRSSFDISAVTQQILDASNLELSVGDCIKVISDLDSWVIPEVEDGGFDFLEAAINHIALNDRLAVPIRHKLDDWNQSVQGVRAA